MTAAALPEVAATVSSNVMMVAGLRSGDVFLVHGGAGGIGTFAIQLAAAVGARVLTTAGSPEKLAFCAGLGADVTIDYREQDFVEEVRPATDGHGADVILDNMGAAYLGRNVSALAVEGRLVVIGLRRPSSTRNASMRKRAAIVATTLRARPVADKMPLPASPSTLPGRSWPTAGSAGASSTPRRPAGGRCRGAPPSRERRPDPPGRLSVRPRCCRRGDAEQQSGQQHVIGPDGQPVAVPADAVEQSEDAHDDGQGDDLSELTELLVRAAAKVMRIAASPPAARGGGSSAPLDDATQPSQGRDHRSSIKELETDWLPSWSRSSSGSCCRSPKTPRRPTPSSGSPGSARRLVEGLFHGIQTAIYAQQVSARAQFGYTRRALPSGWAGPAGPRLGMPRRGTILMVDPAAPAGTTLKLDLEGVPSRVYGDQAADGRAGPAG